MRAHSDSQRSFIPDAELQITVNSDVNDGSAGLDCDIGRVQQLTIMTSFQSTYVDLPTVQDIR